MRSIAEEGKEVGGDGEQHFGCAVKQTGRAPTSMVTNPGVFSDIPDRGGKRHEPRDAESPPQAHRMTKLLSGSQASETSFALHCVAYRGCVVASGPLFLFVSLFDWFVVFFFLFACLFYLSGFFCTIIVFWCLWISVCA